MNDQLWFDITALILGGIIGVLSVGAYIAIGDYVRDEIRKIREEQASQ